MKPPPYTTNPPLYRAIEAAGGFRALADKLGITRQAVWQWRQCPVRWVLDIERLSGVPRTLLRPDIYPPHQRRQRA